MTTVKVWKNIVAPVVPVFQQFTGVHIGQTLDASAVPRRLDRAGMELTAFEQNRMYTIAQRKAGVRIETTFRFEPVRGATRVTAEFACEPDSTTSAPAEPLPEANEERVAQALTHDLTDMKRLIETPPQPAYTRLG